MNVQLNVCSVIVLLCPYSMAFLSLFFFLSMFCILYLFTFYVSSLALAEFATQCISALKGYSHARLFIPPDPSNVSLYSFFCFTSAQRWMCLPTDDQLNPNLPNVSHLLAGTGCVTWFCTVSHSHSQKSSWLNYRARAWDHMQYFSLISQCSHVRSVCACQCFPAVARRSLLFLNLHKWKKKKSWRQVQGTTQPDIVSTYAQIQLCWIFSNMKTCSS